MSINGQQIINIGLPNESIGSDSLYTAFNKTEDNFTTLFTCASPYTNFVALTGIGVNSNANTGTVSITNTGVTNIIAGTNITISQANGNVTISSTGGGNGGGSGTVTSVGLAPVSTGRIVVTNSPIVSSGNIGIDLATTGVVPGTYTAPTVTLDAYGRITSAANTVSSGTVTSVGIIPGSGIGVASSPVTTVGNITVTNTGVVRLTAGLGITLSGPNGIVQVSSAYTGTVTSVGISSNTLTVSSSPVTASGNIVVELPSAITLSGNITAANGNLGNLVTANFFSGDGGLLSNIQAPAFSYIANGTSNVRAFTNGNVTVSVAGNANVAVVTGTGANIAGTANISGNANVGNIGASFGVFTANVTAGNVYANSGTIGATSLAGTLTTAAQPNVTSVGTLGSLTVTGKVTAGQLQGDGGNISNIQGGNVSGAVSFATTANAVAGANVSGAVAFATTANTVAGANVSGAVSFATTANAVAGANVSGAVTFATTANTVAGANVSGTVATATTAGTVTTAAQPNITSVGTLTSLSVTGNISGANLTGNHFGNGAALSSITGANVTGTVPTANNSSFLGGTAAANYLLATGTGSSLTAIAGANVTGTVANANNSAFLGGTAAASYLLATGTGSSLTAITGANVTGTVANATAVVGSVQNGITTLGALTTLSTGANTIAGTITGNWSLSAGSRLSATYADLAEYYQADVAYEPGTVLMFGGNSEVTLAEDATTRVAGVVSTNPAYAMNSSCPDIAVAVALQGRVPCKVQGNIRKGDMMISAGNGYAVACSEPRLGQIIGKALENFDLGNGVIEIVVGRL